MRSLGSAVLVLLALFMCSCNDRSASQDEVVGSYVGTIRGARETIVLRPDGSYSQDVAMPSGEKLTSSGSWRLQHRAIRLDGYLAYYDTFKDGMLTSPRKTNNFGYTWSPTMLINDWGGGYHTLERK